jgi:hypothetical protein
MCHSRACLWLQRQYKRDTTLSCLNRSATLVSPKNQTALPSIINVMAYCERRAIAQAECIISPEQSSLTNV